MSKVLRIFVRILYTFSIAVGVLMVVAINVYANKKSISLPDYVVYDPMKNTPVPAMLRAVAKKCTFPLSKQDKKDIKILTAKFDAEGNCAGLAAPQIGISKRVIIFAVSDDPDLKKFRSDIIGTMPKTIWINPVYKGIESFGYKKDYEACFSVANVAGPVKRYRKILYEAYTPQGKLVKGTAEGFLARVIQHETDHLDGILFSDKVAKGKLMSMEEYRNMRMQQLKDRSPDT